jgi:predicted metal-dependent phosphoesterase TrpH
MLIETHCHTKERSPCSEITAFDLIRRAMAKGLQGVVLTDHHYLWSDADLNELRRELKCPAEFVLLSGQEVTTRDFDDVLVYGASEAFPFGTPLTEIRRQAPEAAIVWAHPFRGIKRPGIDLLFSALLDAVEIFNRNHRMVQNRYAFRLWQEWGFVATAGTDVHDELIGIFPSWFNGQIHTLNDFVQAIRNGRCRPHMKRFKAV